LVHGLDQMENCLYMKIMSVKGHVTARGISYIHEGQLKLSLCYGLCILIYVCNEICKSELLGGVF